MYGNGELDVVVFCTDAITSVVRRLFRFKYEKMDKIWLQTNVDNYDSDRMIFDMLVVEEMSKQQNAKMKKRG